MKNTVKKAVAKKAVSKDSKKKEVKTLVSFILDRSGSMMAQRKSVIKGVNEYLATLKKDDNNKNILFTLTQFDTEVSVMYKNLKLNDVQELNEETYVPNGWTALYDAIGKTMQSINNSEFCEHNSKILCIVMTDGHENSSKEFNHQQVKSLITEKTKAGWTFIYLGATADAWDVGANLGISFGNTVKYHGDDVLGAIRGVGAVTANYASTSQVGVASMDLFNSLDNELLKELNLSVKPDATTTKK